MNNVLKSKVLERKEDLLDDYSLLFQVIEDLEEKLLEYVNNEKYYYIINLLLQFYEIINI